MPPKRPRPSPVRQGHGSSVVHGWRRGWSSAGIRPGAGREERPVGLRKKCLDVVLALLGLAVLVLHHHFVPQHLERGRGAPCRSQHREPAGQRLAPGNARSRRGGGAAVVIFGSGRGKGDPHLEVRDAPGLHKGEWLEEIKGDRRRLGESPKTWRRSIRQIGPDIPIVGVIICVKACSFVASPELQGPGQYFN